MSSKPDDQLSVLVITIDEYYYIPKFLKSILDADSIDTIAITTVPISLGTDSLWRFGIDLMQRFGLRVTSSHVRFYLKHMLSDLRYRVGAGGEPRSVSTVAKGRGIEHRHVSDVNAEDYVEYASGLQPDVIASVAATQKFESDLLNVPTQAAINVHSSLLPEYRGVSPSFWTLLNGEDQTGVTAHFMDENLDTGDIIVQRPIEINETETLHSLNERVAEVGAEVLLEGLEGIRTGNINATPIDPEKGAYYSLPEREDVRAFRQKGNRFY
jgi:folate-dependent phosphoribosylglycinamide formyltransferase PurN